MSDKFVPESHYGLKVQVEPFRVCQNYSQVGNHELAARTIMLTQPHLRGAAQSGAINKVSSLFDDELTRMWSDIADFHHRYGLDYSGAPRSLPDDMFVFRVLFMGEELEEYAGLPKGSLVRVLKQLLDANPPQKDSLQRREDQLDALVDLIYVTLGTAYLQGFNFAEAWRRVQRANMSKVRVERPEDSKRGSGFDVVKPEGWKAPCHADLVGELDQENGLAHALGYYGVSESEAAKEDPDVSSLDSRDDRDDLGTGAGNSKTDHQIF